MKKILLIAIMLFSVVCFASPPPEIVSDIVTDDVGWVVQDSVTVNDINVTEIFAANLQEYGLIAQEVAFVDIGNINLSDATMTENYTIVCAGNTNSEIPLYLNGSLGLGDSC